MGSVGYFVTIIYRDGDDEKRVEIDAASPIAQLRKDDKFIVDADGKPIYARVIDAHTTFTLKKGRLISQTTELWAKPEGLFEFIP